MEKTSRFFQLFLTLCLILGILAQVESIRIGFRMMLYVAWAAMFFLYVCLTRHSIKFTKQSRILVIMLLIIYLWRVILIIFGKFDSFPQLGVSLLIDAVAYLFGSWIAANCDDGFLAKILIHYSLAVGVFAIYLYRTYLPSVNTWISTVVYHYASKNSAAQLIAQSAIFLSFLWSTAYPGTYRTLFQVIRYSIIGIDIVIVCMLRCRTAMLALVVAALYYIFRWEKKRRFVYVAIIVALILAIVIIEPVRKFAESALLLNKYGEGATLNQFSSGRISNIEEAIQLWKENMLFGVGQILIDCNPLALVLDSGIVGAIPYFVFWLSTVKSNLLRKYIINDPFKKTLQVLTIYYCVTACLEGYPPFGPGVCVVPLWLLSGYCEVRNERIKYET